MSDYDDVAQRESLVRDDHLDSEASDYRSNLKKHTLNPSHQGNFDHANSVSSAPGHTKSMSEQQQKNEQSAAGVLIDREANKAQEEKKTPARFWMLFLFGCCTLVNACGWIQLSPLFTLIEEVSLYFFTLITID